MTNKQSIDAHVDSLVSDARAALADALGDVASTVRDRVGKPVGYAIGPRGGVRKIRSKRGEPPRRDTGRLQKSVESAAIEIADKIAGSVYVGAPYAEPLQHNLDRPILSDVLEATEDLVLDRLAGSAARLG